MDVTRHCTQKENGSCRYTITAEDASVDEARVDVTKYMAAAAIPSLLKMPVWMRPEWMLPNTTYTKKTPVGIIILSLPARLAVAELLPNHTHTHTHTHDMKPLDAILSLLSLPETLAVAVVLPHTTHTHTQKHWMPFYLYCHC